MEQVWARRQPVTVRDVLVALQPTRPVAYTTVMTVMHNLVRKGLLVREPAGRAHRFEATTSASDLAAALMAEVLTASADRDAVLLQFAAGLDDADVDALAAAVRRRRRGDRRRSRS